MKQTLSILILTLSISSVLSGQNLDCSKYKNGYFKIQDESGNNVSYIARQSDMQIETIQGRSSLSELKVAWLDDCTYTLTPTEETLKRDSFLPLNAVIRVEIIETKEDSYLLNTATNFSELEFIFEANRIDSVEFEEQRSENFDIAAKLEVVKIFQEYMANKNYEKAISVFSTSQQKRIREYRSDAEWFEHWCQAWTLDKDTYQRYFARVKSGKGDFVFEDGEWRISEN